MIRWMRISVALLALLLMATSAAYPEDKPNIVLILADNLGYGELGSYGGGETRGAPTPKLDALAREGTRLTNFNVEPSCTPSRSALMTGRYSIRSGTYSVPTEGGLYGLVQWEITIAKLLSKQGYATAHYGKWHLGDSEGRYPNDQGFDEWYAYQIRPTRRCGRSKKISIRRSRTSNTSWKAAKTRSRTNSRSMTLSSVAK